MSWFKFTVLMFALGAILGIAPASQEEVPSLKLERKQNGIPLILLVNQYRPRRSTLHNKTSTRVITPASDGKFLIDLSAGNYPVSVFFDNSGDVDQIQITDESSNGYHNIFSKLRLKPVGWRVALRISRSTGICLL